MHFLKHECLMKEFSSGTKSFSFPSMLMQILHLIIVILPSFPQTTLDHENLVDHLFW
jgi:hypothetical protein